MAFLGTVSSCNESISLGFQPVSGETTVNLKSLKSAVIDARGNINEIRMLLKGDVESLKLLFKIAVEEGDVVTQIQLSHALFGIKWGKDNTKDFSSLVVGDLEAFSYYPREFELFNSAYDLAMEVEADRKTCDARGLETFRMAASRGYLPAFLELTSKEWGKYTSSYGFAVQLQPFVGKGDKLLDYYFGQALKNGCQIGSEPYYEGLYWMNQSCGIPVKYPKGYQSFEEFKSFYIERQSGGSTYYSHDGFLHVGESIILAPSQEAWETFVEEKLRHVKFAPSESYLFKYDPKQIKFLLDGYKISVVPARSCVKSSDEERHAQQCRGETVHFFYIDSLLVYQNDRKIGEISVQEDSFKIHQTFKDPKIQPIIEFIENVITRTGFSDSARSWLKQFEKLL
ncbi:MAG: hypothetical protein JSS62_07045 [Verrucomicrobia bacterium]|nr:hypothetical protein [Verrucomicrobiota bacterium]MBS0646739.1 hypothetical protein [Verrucomicrobiota bacterium]